MSEAADAEMTDTEILVDVLLEKLKSERQRVEQLEEGDAKLEQRFDELQRCLREVRKALEPALEESPAFGDDPRSITTIGLAEETARLIPTGGFCRGRDAQIEVEEMQPFHLHREGGKRFGDSQHFDAVKLITWMRGELTELLRGHLDDEEVDELDTRGDTEEIVERVAEYVAHLEYRSRTLRDSGNRMRKVARALAASGTPETDDDGEHLSAGERVEAITDDRDELQQLLDDAVDADEVAQFDHDGARYYLTAVRTSPPESGEAEESEESGYTIYLSGEVTRQALDFRGNLVTARQIIDGSGVPGDPTEYVVEPLHDEDGSMVARYHPSLGCGRIDLSDAHRKRFRITRRGKR